MASAPVMAGIIDPDSCEGSNQRGLDVEGMKKNAQRLIPEQKNSLMKLSLSKSGPCLVV